MKICEIYKSIQGEGLTMGLPTVFIRTVGCNLECSWCDTPYAMSGGTEMTVHDIMEKIGDCKTVCITGGEPLLQKEIDQLFSSILASGKKIVLETNGAMDIKNVPKDPNLMISMDIKCPSSGMTDRMLESNLEYLSDKDQLKFVIKDQADLDFAIDYVKNKPVPTNVIFGPVGGKDRLDWLAEEVIKNNVNVRVLPQLHKIIWGNKQGV